MQGIVNLQTDGTMKHEAAVGSEGQVYVRIRAGSTGEVQVPVQGSLRTMTARAKDKKTQLETGTLIRVVDTIGSTLIVEELLSSYPKEKGQLKDNQIIYQILQLQYLLNFHHHSQFLILKKQITDILKIKVEDLL